MVFNAERFIGLLRLSQKESYHWAEYGFSVHEPDSDSRTGPESSRPISCFRLIYGLWGLCGEGARDFRLWHIADMLDPLQNVRS